MHSADPPLRHREAPVAEGLLRRTALAGLLLGLGGALRAQTPSPGGARVPRFSTAPAGPDLPPGWVHETLPKVERANRYTLVADAGETVLQVQSRASASTLVALLNSPPATATTLTWRWKVSRSLAGSDLRSKAGDDYAARLYVLFDLPLEALDFGDRLRIRTARALAGREIPTAALCYVWGHAQPVGTVAPNPYTDRVRMVVVDSGQAHAGQWRAVRRDLSADWQQAFGGAMPGIRAVAVGADTDNTGYQVDAWFGDVGVG